MRQTIQQSVVYGKTRSTTDCYYPMFRGVTCLHDVEVKRLATYQDACREVLEARVRKHKRAGAAAMLGVSVQGLDYLRAGFVKSKKTGKVTPRWITFEHLAKLAEAEDRSYAALLEEVLFALQLLQSEREVTPRTGDVAPASAATPARSPAPVP